VWGGGGSYLIFDVIAVVIVTIYMKQSGWGNVTMSKDMGCVGW
jgi:hypothetical protein